MKAYIKPETLNVSLAEMQTPIAMSTNRKKRDDKWNDWNDDEEENYEE